MSDFVSILVFFVLPLLLAYMARVKTEKVVCASVPSHTPTYNPAPPCAYEPPTPTLSVLNPSRKKQSSKKFQESPLPKEDGATIIPKSGGEPSNHQHVRPISKEERADIINALVKYGVRKSTAEILIEQSIQAGCNNREDCFVWCMQNMK